MKMKKYMNYYHGVKPGLSLESSGIKTLINMKPNRLEDIIALVALYRPINEHIPIYNECKHGKRKPDYLHPKLEQILKPTME